ncbi:hypothetical protein KDK77_07970, partial [bacterium]|nr:hypothetical protein [bacterium]
MGISHKKQKYIKRFAGVKSAVQLARETGLSLDTVSKILKDYGYDSYSSSAVPASEPKKTLNLHSILFSILITTVILVPLFFLPGLYDMYSLPKMAVLYVVYPLCIVLWFVDICLKKKVSLYRIFTFPFAPLILFFIWAVLSLFRCINYYEAVIHLQKWLCMGVFFWVTLHVMREPRQLRVVAVGIMLSSVAVAVIGIFQFFGVNPEFLYQAAVPGATFGNKNFAAQYIVATIPFSLFAAYAYRGKGFSKVCSFTFFILVYFLLLTRTRGAWVSSTAGLGIGTVLCIVCLIKRKSEFGIRIEWKKMLFHHILPGAFVTGILIVSALMPAGDGQTAGSKRTVNIGEEL